MKPLPNLSRKMFEKYLNSMTMDQPFCKGKNCPISQYYSDTYNLDIVVFNDERLNIDGKIRIKNPPWIRDFVQKIDLLRSGWWETVTPTKCLLALWSNNK